MTVYPPDSSRTLFDAVATSDPTITVKVIIAILPEKCFIPKNDEVNAEVMVGQAPYDIPVRHTPIMQSAKESTDTAIRVTVAAPIVRIFAQSIVLRQPIESNRIPVRMRPTPLHIERIPTRETANASGASTDRARSLAKLITELPTAARKDMHINAIQKDGRESI